MTFGQAQWQCKALMLQDRILILFVCLFVCSQVVCYIYFTRIIVYLLKVWRYIYLVHVFSYDLTLLLSFFHRLTLFLSPPLLFSFHLVLTFCFCHNMLNLLTNFLWTLNNKIVLPAIFYLHIVCVQAGGFVCFVLFLY